VHSRDGFGGSQIDALYLLSARIRHLRELEAEMLMQAAYCVHSAVAPYLPFEIPRDKKIMITKMIQTMDMLVSAPLDMLDGSDKEKTS
jgi:hypothetical protein